MSSLSEMARKVRDVPFVGTPPDTWDNTPEPDDVPWDPPLASDPTRRRKYREKLEYWLEHPYELSERWAVRAKRELNEQPDIMPEQVDELRKLVQGHPGLNSRTDDHFLLTFLRSKRHELESAHSSLVKYYTMRALNPTYFELCLPSAFLDIYKLKFITILEGYDVLGRPICYFSADFPPSSITNRVFIQMIVHLLEFLIIDPRVQVSGITVLVNLEKQSVAHAKLITIKFLKLMLQIFQGSFPVRLKKIIICHGSFLFRATYSILKPFIPEKFKDRIIILSSDLSNLPLYIPLNVLPPELMGQSPVVREDILSERIALVEDKMTEWQNYGFEDLSLLPNRVSMDFSGEEEPPIPIDDKTLQEQLAESFMQQTKPSQPHPTPPTEQIHPMNLFKPIETMQSEKPIDAIQPTQPIQLTQPTQRIQPIQATQPTQPIQLTQPTQRIQPIQATQPAQPIQPIVLPQAIQLILPTHPIQPIPVLSVQSIPNLQPIDSFQSAQQPQLTQFAQTTHSNHSLQSTQPIQSIQPTQSVQLAPPTQPIQLIQLVQPTQSTPQMDSIQPIHPTPSIHSIQLIQLILPNQPIEPTQSIQLIQPMQTTQLTQSIQLTQSTQLIEQPQLIQMTQPIQMSQPIQNIEPTQANQSSESTSQDERNQPPTQLNQLDHLQPNSTKKESSKCYHKRVKLDNQAQDNN